MATTRPGTAPMIGMRSPKHTASSTSWVTNSTGIRYSDQIASSASCMRARVCASRAPNGSSIKGELASVRAIPARRPKALPDSGGLGQEAHQTEKGAGNILGGAPLAGHAWPKATFQNTVFQGTRECCGLCLPRLATGAGNTSIAIVRRIRCRSLCAQYRYSNAIRIASISAPVPRRSISLTRAFTAESPCAKIAPRDVNRLPAPG